MQKTNRLILFVIISVILFKSVTSLSFVSSPYMDNTTETYQSMLCYWNATSDTSSSNVTWYNSSTLYSGPSAASSPAVIGTNIIKRNEIWMCKVTISNGTNTISENTSITVKNGRPKNLKMYNSTNSDVGLNITLYEDNSYSFHLNATDPDLDTLKYGDPFSSIPGNSILNVITGAFTWTPSTDADAGSYNVTFIAYDPPYNSIESLSIIMGVVAVNDAPVFSSVSDRTSTEGVYFEYNISATDEENNFPLRFEIVNDSGLNLGIQNISNTTVRIYFNPQFYQAGNHTVSIRVNDSKNASTSAQFVIEVIGVNHLPNITYIQNSSGVQGGAFLMQVNATDIDVNDTLIMSITSNCQNYPNIWNASVTQFNNSANNSYWIINVTNLTNNYVVCRDVIISVNDHKQNSSSDYNMTLNITNINDAPIIYDNSSYSTNLANNINIYSLRGYQFVRFDYRLNFTDPDIDTYQGDNVNLSTNFSEFDINFSNVNGRINFTTNNSGIYYIYVTASDAYGLSANKTLILNITQHSLPYFNNIVNVTINESELFYYAINASGESNLTYYTNASIFTINSTTGEINFTPSQLDIGNYSILVWAVDDVGATNYSTFWLNVINKNDAPVLSGFSDFNNVPLVVGHSFYYRFNASDNDLNLPAQYSYDSLTYYTNTTIFTINTTSGEIFFTPSSSDIGNHSVNIGVNDSLGLYNNRTLSFTIYNISQAPNIMNITPYGTPLSTYTNFGWISTVGFNGVTGINISENMSVIFNHTTVNPESYETVNYSWFLNGVLKSTDYSYSHNFDFFSNGSYNVTLIANDSHYSSSNFTWIVNVTNVNRPVVFLNPIDNRTGNKSITGKTTVSPFFTLSNNGTFYDPDDDIDSNGRIDDNETNNLVFSYNWSGDGLSDALTVELNSTDGTFTPLKTAQTAYTFMASDGVSNATTSKVFFNLTVSSQSGQNTQTTTVTRTVTRVNNVYKQVEVDKIKTISLIVPQSAIMYDNNTLVIPITLENNENSTIKGINLSASTNNSEIKMYFDKNYFPEILQNDKETTYLRVNSYRTQGKYEISISALVSEPSFNDTAMVIVSSIQKENDKDPESTTKTMISFAKDLLSTNPKCLELNEMFNDVEKDLSQKKYDNAQKKIDEIVKTCRYLNSEKTLINEEPKNIYVSMQRIKNNPQIFYTMLSVIMLSLVGVGYSIYYTNRKVKHD